LTYPYCTSLWQSESIKKSSLRSTIVHSATISSFLLPSWKLTVIDRASLRLSESNQKHIEHMRNQVGKPLPVCCHHRGFVWNRVQQSCPVRICRVNTSENLYSRINMIRRHTGWVMLVQSFSIISQVVAHNSGCVSEWFPVR